AAPTPPAAAPAAAPAESAAIAPAAAACIEVGDFGAADGQRFAERLDELGLRPQAVVRQVGDSGEAAGYMVYLAPPPDRAQLDARLAELRQQGVRDFYVLPPSAVPAGAISLGVFKSEEAARTQLAGLVKKGVRGARIQARGARQAFQLRALEPQQQAAFDRLRADFPAQEARACGGD
ncbi:MAG: SPOR domain-containing protein, partial [Burkholderiaceae bacterium]